jgi:hypothetical protein
MKTLLNLIFIVTLIFLESCIQAPNSARKSTVSSATTTGTKTPGTTVAPTFASDENIYWYTSSKYTGTVTVNKSSQDVVYLRGQAVHNFLSAKDISGVEYYRKTYCLAGNFTISAGVKPQLRVRAVPIYITTSTKAIERLLRLDIPNTSDNQTLCNFAADTTPAFTATAFSLPQICTNCTSMATTTDLNLYTATSSALIKVPSTSLDMTGVLLRVDLQSNSTDGSSSCTNASCSAKGFDCCITGQCVKDASEKINASIDPQYTQAKIDYSKNPLSFINYPNIFNICSNIAHTPVPSGTTTTTPVSDAQARVTKYIQDYTCLSDVSAGIGYNNCRDLNSSGVATVIDKTSAAYDAIKKKLSIACGCTATDSEMSVKCPDWGIIPVYLAGAIQTNANITDFKCYTPQPANPIGPITNLNVTVPNRSAPHRFYSSAGVNFDDIAGLSAKAPTTVQEGDDFYYLDEFNKIGPVNGSFNINSILGKMTIDLSHTLPAKQVTVELGKTYILSATSGFFTPCSQCAKDFWFQTFTAHPNSQRGVGLQASGYTTSRDTYSANTTFGNYEDTKFGRACYVPVTMLSLAHQKNASLQTQRQNRLKTQAALYVNGYQRDWYGFNKGALIGSFDGVTWFAIGTGRRITATTTKLFLALNSAFLDLADKTDTIVNIIPDFSANTAADVDYDPDMALTDPRQNTAATCQKFHQCTADADCVSQLGWEYVCADVSQSKTKWPVFDSDGKEIVNQERTGSLFEILQSTISTSNNKRCVYRGQGAVCKRDYTTLNDLNKKALTCAPNFYCASVTTNKFNEELVRSPNELDDILFGMDANVLGRPLNYVTASKSLSTDIITNIKYNATGALGLSSADGDDFGICRPGRQLTNIDVKAHSNPDSNKRTDYISQIASCNSATFGSDRFLTCPAFSDELNYVEDTATDAFDLKQTQNSCGGESKHITTKVSAFKGIEGLSLLNMQNITSPILVQDACYRRAGSVCHTDLDCGPNKMHEEAVGSIDIKYFGGTEGEQSYWRESLICGQGTPVPALGSKDYFNYKLSDNRCCREIGKDFTMYTKGSKTVIPENKGTNETLDTTKFSYANPAAAGRYSRYTVSKEAIDDLDALPVVKDTEEPKPNQWKVINETGSLTCCGGGWIRKFADGTHDWKVKNRLSIDANNFSCLNFRSPLADSSYTSFAADKIVATSYSREYDQFCKSPDIGGCMQIPYPETNGFNITAPKAYNPASIIAADNNWVVAPGGYSTPASGQSRINTSPTADPIDGSTPWTQLLNSDVPYAPVPYYFSPIPYDVESRTNKAYNFFVDRTFDYGVEMYLPAYVGYDGTRSNSTYIQKVYIKYFYDSPQLPEVHDITAFVDNTAQCEAVFAYNSPSGMPIDEMNVDAAAQEGWCVGSSAKTGNRPVINVHANTNGLTPSDKWKYAGIIIDFIPVENKRTTQVAEPGNELYYLSKLARLELLGIPQITYEPLYCNNDQTKVVPGIFKSTYSTRGTFEAAANTYSSYNPIAAYKADDASSTTENAGYGTKGIDGKDRFTYQDKVDHAAVFSSKDFTCCTPLGKTGTAAKCCSGFAVTSTDGKTSTCKLPSGTDLNVYFNKFVSSEGVGTDLPNGPAKGLVVKGTSEEVDFNDYTGEPKYRRATYDRLETLGVSYCSTGKFVLGGAFGKFPPEPFSGSYTVQSGTSGNLEDSFPISIVDSVLDFEASDPTVGKVPFDSGYRWNHHYYCK